MWHDTIDFDFVMMGIAYETNQTIVHVRLSILQPNLIVDLISAERQTIKKWTWPFTFSTFNLSRNKNAKDCETLQTKTIVSNLTSDFEKQNVCKMNIVFLSNYHLWFRHFCLFLSRTSSFFCKNFSETSVDDFSSLNSTNWNKNLFEREAQRLSDENSRRYRSICNFLFLVNKNSIIYQAENYLWTRKKNSIESSSIYLRFWPRDDTLKDLRT